MAEPIARREARRLWLPEAIQLRESGLTLKQISAQIGVGSTAISTRLPTQLRTLDPHLLRDRREAAKAGVNHRSLTTKRLSQQRYYARQRIAFARPLYLDRRILGGAGPEFGAFVADPNGTDPVEAAVFAELERTVIAHVGTVDLDEIASLDSTALASLRHRLIDLGLAADHRQPLANREVDTRDVWTPPEISGTRTFAHAVWARGAACDDDGEPLDPDNYWRDVGGTGRGRCICGELSPILDTQRLRVEWLDQHVQRFVKRSAA